MAGVVAWIDQVVQIGQEATIYTEVPANRLLQLIKFNLKQDPATVQVRPTGQRVDAASFVNTILTDVTISGPIDYHEFLLAAEMMFGAATPSVPVGGTLSHERVYELLRSGAITPKTTTVQWGDATYANQAAGMELVTMSGTYDRENGSVLSASGYAVAQDGAGTTLTASPTTYSISPARGPHLNFYLDTTGAGLGGTQILEEVLSVQWTISNLRKPFWAANRAKTSYTKSLSAESAVSQVVLSLGESAAIRTVVNNMLAGATYFLRVDNQGPLIEGSITQQHRADIAIQLQSMTEYKNANSVYARDLTCVMVHDATWGHSFMLDSITDLATL